MPDEFDLALVMLFRERASDGTGARAGGLPASADQIAALERHWGWQLPPLYRRLLAKHNGAPSLWFDVELLSTGTIIDGSRKMRAFKATAPQHWRWIFACGTQSRDALAFDPFRASDDGELPVVHLGEAGEVARWPSLHPLVERVLCRTVVRDLGLGKTTWCLWTGLRRYWSYDSSPHARVFTTRDNTAQYAGCDGLFVQHSDVDVGRLLPQHVLVEADRRFAHGVRELGNEKRRLAIVLTEAPAQASATEGYVYYEPGADLVVALSTVEMRASVCATDSLWGWEPSFTSLSSSATALLEQGRVADALLNSIDWTCELFRRMASDRQGV